MLVTELAIIPLTHNLTKENPNLPASLKQKFISAKLVLEKASAHKFYFFQQVEDPSIIYILGSWKSPQAHATFLPSAENQELLELFKDDIITEEKDGKRMRMWHLDADVFSGVNGEDKSVFTAPVVTLNRHFVPKDKKAEFIEKFDEVKGLLEDFTTPYQVVGGWRIEKEKEGKRSGVYFRGLRARRSITSLRRRRGLRGIGRLWNLWRGLRRGISRGLRGCDGSVEAGCFLRPSR